MTKKKSGGTTGGTAKGRGRGKPIIHKLDDSNLPSETEHEGMDSDEEPSNPTSERPDCLVKAGGITPQKSKTQSASSASNAKLKWGDRVGTKLFPKQESKIWAKQPPAFTLSYDDSVEDADEVIMFDEEIEEGVRQWKLAVVAMVVGTEGTKKL